MSWCIVQGSPAQTSPNVAGDTTTDNLIWRRHERPTDNIYVNQAGITFRSAINDAWTILDFPIVADPDTTLGTQGDVNGFDLAANPTEFNQLISDCDAAWDAMGRSGIGVTAVNVGLFHDDAGNYVDATGGVVIGWGGCTQSIATGLCVNPYDGLIMVVDNHYLFPTVPDRTFPGTFTQLALTDSVDQLVGHELGHALALPHRTNTTALMNPGQADNDSDGDADNIALNATEVTTVRDSALIVPGLEQDPPESIIQGDVVATRKVDKVREDKALKPYLDLAAVKVTLDTKKNEVAIGIQLFGLIPQETAGLRYWLLIDRDDSKRGAQAGLLKEIGAPATWFQGADVIVMAEVQAHQVTGSVWQLRDGRLQTVDGAKFDLQALVMYPHYVSTKRIVKPVPIHHVVVVKLPNEFLQLDLGKPFRIQAISFQEETRVIDKLDDTREEQGVTFTLEHPSFSHCYPRGDVRPGGRVKIDIEGLKPRASIHGLLGPRLVFKGNMGRGRKTTIDFQIPRDAKQGLHLVTIGIDGTALTADCVVNVVAPRKR